MKRFLIILCAMALVFGWTTSGVAALDYNQPPIADAMVNSANPTVNYGSDNTLWIQGSAAVLGLLRRKRRAKFVPMD